MLSLMVYGMLAGMVGLVVYELAEEIRGAKHRLHDHYHE
jgi:hypothetical protein